MWVSMALAGSSDLPSVSITARAGDQAADLEAGKLADTERQQAQLLFGRDGRAHHHAHQRGADRGIGVGRLRGIGHLGR